MTVGELIDMLSDYDPKVEVRIMSQPRYPFEYTIHGVWANDAEHYGLPDDKFDNAIYITEGDQIGYGTARAWQQED